MEQRCLTQAMKWKLEMFRSIADKMPAPLGTTIKETEAAIVRSLHEATSEYIKEGPTAEQENNLKSIPVD